MRVIPHRGGTPGYVQRGVPSWSLDKTLARRPLVPCWDVNGYYADLGVPWPYTDASTGDLRRAYLAADGPNDARLTFVFTQLLDPVTKAVYDAAPLGSRLIDEHERWQQRQQVLDRRNGEDVSHDTATWTLDNDDPVAQDEGSPAEDTDESEPYPYSVYLWGTDQYDLGALEQWQALILDESRFTVSTQIQVSLGSMEGMQTEWMVGHLGGSPVVFIDRFVPPTRGHARGIVQALSQV